MSKLNELIAELCPNGVEYVPLWSVTIWDKKFNSVDRKKQPKSINYPYLLAKDLFALETENGNVFLLSTGEQIGWTNEELAGRNMCEGEVVTIPWGKSRAVVDCIKYYKGKFVTADNRIMTSNDTSKLLNKYLYYWTMSKGKVIDTFYRGSGIKHPDMSKVLDMKIPVPPLPVQEEIVRILDSFTSLTAELQAELQARQKQYEYYRDQLLTFDVHGGGTSEVQWKTLLEVCESIADGDHMPPPKSEFGVPFITISNITNQQKIDFNNTMYVPEDYYDFLPSKRKPQLGDILYTVVGSYGIPVCVENEKKFVFQRHIAILRPDQKLIKPKYLYHTMQTTFFRNQAEKAAKGAAQKTISLSSLGKMKLLLPPLSVQEKIVEVLDNFDAICSDLNIGLPAEIEARQKQYEYYRDALLSFGCSHSVNVERERERERES